MAVTKAPRRQVRQGGDRTHPGEESEQRDLHDSEDLEALLKLQATALRWGAHRGWGVWGLGTSWQARKFVADEIVPATAIAARSRARITASRLLCEPGSRITRLPRSRLLCAREVMIPR